MLNLFSFSCSPNPANTFMLLALGEGLLHSVLCGTILCVKEINHTYNHEKVLTITASVMPLVIGMCVFLDAPINSVRMNI